MKRWLVLGVALLSLALALTGCASADEGAVRQVVTDAERTMEDVLGGETSAPSIELYFATLEEGANPSGLGNTRAAVRKLLTDHASGVSRVEVANFRIIDVQVHSDAKLARVRYQLDVKMVHGDRNGSATVTQDLALLNTATRGWRISGGDAPQLSNVVGQVPKD